MDTNTVIIGAVLAIVFLVLALVAIFRFDKVKNTFEIFGMKIGIWGSKADENNRPRRGPSKDIRQLGHHGKASIKIGGSVANSRISAESSTESEVDIRKDVKQSDIRAKGGQSK